MDANGLCQTLALVHVYMMLQYIDILPKEQFINCNIS